jgi:Skp family chaperone for outer membrane proteins
MIGAERTPRTVCTLRTLRTVRTFTSLALVSLLSTPAFAQAVDAVRIGAVSFTYIARNSKTANASLAEVQAFERKKTTDVEARAAQLQKQQVELQQQSASMSPRAVADLQRAFEKSRLEFTRFQRDTQAEVEAMQQKFEAEFRVKLAPIVDAISKEKGLYFVFGIEQTSLLAWWSPAVDISEEVVKRLDAR